VRVLLNGTGVGDFSPSPPLGQGVFIERFPGVVLLSGPSIWLPARGGGTGQPRGKATHFWKGGPPQTGRQVFWEMSGLFDLNFPVFLTKLVAFLMGVGFFFSPPPVFP